MDAAPARLQIRRYENRRFYDSTRSRHVTLSELHDLICAGHELTITDSRSGEDITNLVLMHILLERDPLKLAIFPPNILHLMIRTQQQFLDNVLQQFFRQVLASHLATQQRWADFLSQTLGVRPGEGAGPADLTRAWIQALVPGAPAGPPTQAAGPATDELGHLRSELAALRARLDRLTRGRARRGARAGGRRLRRDRTRK